MIKCYTGTLPRFPLLFHRGNRKERLHRRSFSVVLIRPRHGRKVKNRGTTDEEE
nr:MAG TPA: hypothetical protein [Caudoviricetes sp.]